MLANISLSNVKLLQMMARNSQEVSGCVRQLELHRETQGKAIASGLVALTSLQRQMSETDTNLLYYSELLHLTKRRFEILEQICAAPDVLTAVLREINIRKSFKKQYLKVEDSSLGFFLVPVFKLCVALGRKLSVPPNISDGSERRRRHDDRSFWKSAASTLSCRCFLPCLTGLRM